MKQTTLITLLLLSSFSFSQNDRAVTRADWNPERYQVGKMYPGYVITTQGDTVNGFLKAGNRCSIDGIGASNQNTAVFYTNETDKKPVAKYKPEDIKGYRIADKVYESINYSGGLFKKANFNLVVEDGAIRTYEWYATVENYSVLRRGANESWQDFDTRRFDIKLIIAKNPTEPIDFSMLGLSFAKKMPELISDNREMAQKVANKEKGYTVLNLFEVIREYNQWAETNK